MNATDTTARVSAHADCTHEKTKTARAACRRARRAEWVAVIRADVNKGDELRVTTADNAEGVSDVLEGTLLGWGAKRLVLRVDDTRITLAVDDVLKVETRA